MLDFLKRILRPVPKIYGLDHAVLNVKLPPQTMWMNMGYWENTNDFPKACEALLEQVLTTALAKETNPIRVLDVGCGCGDQSLYLLEALGKEPTDLNSTHPNLRRRKNKSLPTLTSYIGVTLEPAQAAIAESRVGNSSIPAQIFCADASNPSLWSNDLSAFLSPQSSEESTWLLALDSMYHFRPSREPILRHARNFNASLMAFDLLLAEKVTWWEKLLLRVVCLGTNAPFGNFLTETEYVQMLVGVGFKREQIEVRDVSEHVFKGLATFMEERVRVGKGYGLSVGMYNVARWVFDWWASGRIVKGVVVVAR